ncbi:MAG TPA: AMP-binding protein [Streptosporangiaceae bacterium]|nr:AMP-binding protein [Streptosporangiaceae bacterium]
MVVRLEEFALQPSSVRLQPEGLLETRAFRELVENLWRQLEIVQDIPGKAIAVETRDPFCAMVGLVALWAVGGVGVPVDPKWPRHRKEQVCIKADVAARLVFDETAKTLRAAARAEIRPDYRDTRFPGGAYILFTSGSSGDPKGVLVSADALERRLCDLLTLLAPRSGGSIAAVSTPTFDISLLEMLLPFVSDVTGWFPEFDVRDRLPGLAKSLMAVRPTIVQGTPTLFSVLISLGWRPPAGTDLWCGGEALPAPLAMRLIEMSDRVWNLYGPTEATIWSTAWQITEQVRAFKVTPIGFPLGSTTVRLEPVTPPGEQGPMAAELWLAGPGLAMEYVQERERTSRCFPVIDGRRWYRTGDLCAADGSGLLHFQGRRDNQVKIRGFRVELEEVEGEIVRMPGVTQAAVIPEARDGVVVRLIAVVVARHLGSHEIRRWCRDNLPGYMCPARVVVTDELPRLASGKVDRRELADRLAVRPAQAEG